MAATVSPKTWVYSVMNQVHWTIRFRFGHITAFPSLSSFCMDVAKSGPHEPGPYHLFPKTCLPISSTFLLFSPTHFRNFITFPSKNNFPLVPACRSKIIKELDLYGLPKEYYDDEWQARQREKTKEFHKRRQEEDDEEERKVEEYRDIGLRLKDYPQEDLKNAKKLKIEEAAEKGELDELVLMVIWNRLDLARRDEGKDAIRSLDLLYRRVEAEILKREATPAMRLLNDLLNMHDGFDDEGWLKTCKKLMVDTFPREDPFSILVPAGFDIDKHQGPLAPAMAMEADDILLRGDFVREVAALLQEVQSEQSETQSSQGLDPESVATRLKQQEKQRAMRQVEALLDLAMNLNW